MKLSVLINKIENALPPNLQMEFLGIEATLTVALHLIKKLGLADELHKELKEMGVLLSPIEK